MLLLGLAGKARAGKDSTFTAIEQIASERGLVVVRRGFSDLLKQSAYRLFFPDGTIQEAVEWAEEFKKGNVYAQYPGGSDEKFDYIENVRVTGRAFLQNFGTEAHRDIFGDNFWVDALLPQGYDNPIIPRWWENFKEDNDYAHVGVIADCRFPNEAQRVRELGGYVVQVVRDVPGAGDHPSEQVLSESLINLKVDNNGPKEALRESVERVLGRVIPEGIDDSANDTR